MPSPTWFTFTRVMLAYLTELAIRKLGRYSTNVFTPSSLSRLLDKLQQGKDWLSIHACVRVYVYVCVCVYVCVETHSLQVRQVGALLQDARQVFHVGTAQRVMR